ncbi:MAG TPA: DUF4288 domain-containing protein [Lacibacter sp.]|nr:DUF4288 domain-containing protein [Lacibacter sp.]
MMYQPPMNWFLVKMVFQIVCGNGCHKAQFEEQIRLIRAAGITAAIEKSKMLAAGEVQPNQWVQWKFIAVTDIYPFTTGIDGAEVFSKVTEEEYEAAYIHTLELKEKAIQQNEFALNHSSVVETGSSSKP